MTNPIKNLIQKQKEKRIEKFYLVDRGFTRMKSTNIHGKQFFKNVTPKDIKDIITQSQIELLSARVKVLRGKIVGFETDDIKVRLSLNGYNKALEEEIQDLLEWISELKSIWIKLKK